MQKGRWCTISREKEGLRINGRIRAEEVRLIDEQNNQVGIVERYEAMRSARDAGLDLVEVSPNTDPPVCRIMDYGKYLYEQKRKIREGRKKSHQHNVALKEIRLKPETDRHDLDIKLKHAREFLEKGHKVQFSVFFKGRQMLHPEKGFEMLDNIVAALEDLAKIERPGRMTGRRMTLLVVPK